MDHKFVQKQTANKLEKPPGLRFSTLSARTRVLPFQSLHCLQSCPSHEGLDKRLYNLTVKFFWCVCGHSVLHFFSSPFFVLYFPQLLSVFEFKFNVSRECSSLAR